MAQSSSFDLKWDKQNKAYLIAIVAGWVAYNVALKVLR